MSSSTQTDRTAMVTALVENFKANGRIVIVPADEAKVREAEFMMLRDGLVVFEGDAGDLRASEDPYLRTFLS